MLVTHPPKMTRPQHGGDEKEGDDDHQAETAKTISEFPCSSGGGVKKDYE